MTDQELINIFRQYKRCVDMKKEQLLPYRLYNRVDERMQMLFLKSGFTDIYDFILAYKKWEIESTLVHYEQLKLFKEEIEL